VMVVLGITAHSYISARGLVHRGSHADGTARAAIRFAMPYRGQARSGRHEPQYGA